jgi:hypothetical protein
MLDSLERIRADDTQIERWMPRRGLALGSLELGEWLERCLRVFKWIGRILFSFVLSWNTYECRHQTTHG